MDANEFAAPAPADVEPEDSAFDFDSRDTPQSYTYEDPWMGTSMTHSRSETKESKGIDDSPIEDEPLRLLRPAPAEEIAEIFSYTESCELAGARQAFELHHHGSWNESTKEQQDDSLQICLANLECAVQATRSSALQALLYLAMGVPHEGSTRADRLQHCRDSCRLLGQNVTVLTQLVEEALPWAVDVHSTHCTAVLARHESSVAASKEEERKLKDSEKEKEKDKEKKKAHKTLRKEREKDGTLRPRRTDRGLAVIDSNESLFWSSLRDLRQLLSIILLILYNNSDEPAFVAQYLRLRVDGDRGLFVYVLDLLSHTHRHWFPVKKLSCLLRYHVLLLFGPTRSPLGTPVPPPPADVVACTNVHAAGSLAATAARAAAAGAETSKNSHLIGLSGVKVTPEELQAQVANFSRMFTPVFRQPVERESFGLALETEAVADRNPVKKQSSLHPPVPQHSRRQSQRKRDSAVRVTGEFDSFVPLPLAVTESLQVMAAGVRAAQKERQWRREVHTKPVDAAGKKAPTSRFGATVDELYAALLPSLPRYCLELMRLLIATSPSTHYCSPLTDLRIELSLDGITDMAGSDLDLRRHKEIILKNVSFVIFGLLCAFKHNATPFSEQKSDAESDVNDQHKHTHSLQFQYLRSLLQQRNCHVLCLKLLSQRVDLSCMKKSELDSFTFLGSDGTEDNPNRLDMSAAAIHQRIATAQALQAVSTRKCFSFVNILRLLQKITKESLVHVNALVTFRAHDILKEVWKSVPQAEFQLYTLKLFKSMMRLLPIKWRETYASLKLITAVFHNVKLRALDSWMEEDEITPSRHAALVRILERERQRVHDYNTRRFGNPSNGTLLVSEGERHRFQPLPISEEDAVQQAVNETQTLVHTLKMTHTVMSSVDANVVRALRHVDEDHVLMTSLPFLASLAFDT